MDAEDAPEPQLAAPSVDATPETPPIEHGAPLTLETSGGHPEIPRRFAADRLAIAMAVGIAALLIVCVALMLIAWHRAPAGPTLAAPGWFEIPAAILPAAITW